MEAQETATQISHRSLDVGDLTIHVAEAGSGPLVLLLHGFPETWHSWRHQLVALAEAGFHAVAPDQRGCGRSGRPESNDDYTLLHLVGDAAGVIDALGEEQAVVVGHDWGAAVAWDMALMRPDLVRGVVGMSVPYQQRGVGGLIGGAIPPVVAMRQMIGDGFYMVYFQEPGVADRELGRDVRATLRRFLYGASGDAPTPWQVVVPPDGGFLDTVAEPDRLPAWLSEEDLDDAAAEVAPSGFTGGLSWYRNIDRGWALTRGPWHKAPVLAPALFIAGDRDAVIAMGGGEDAVTESLRAGVPNLRDAVFLPGCGHWTQQERPAEVNEALIGFLRSLPQA